MTPMRSLPCELIAYIFDYARDYAVVAVCRHWRELAFSLECYRIMGAMRTFVDLPIHALYAAFDVITTTDRHLPRGGISACIDRCGYKIGVDYEDCGLAGTRCGSRCTISGVTTFAYTTTI